MCEPAETLPPLQIPDVERYVPPPVKPGVPSKATEFNLLRKAEWANLSGLDRDNLTAAWGALLQSCGVLKKQESWRQACEAVLQLGSPTNESIGGLLREHFVPYQVTNPDGSDTGLITGYYQPLLKGSRTRTERYRYPLYTKPDDLVAVDLGMIYPDLANRRLRGKMNGNKLVPYYSRGEIDVIQSPLEGRELVWVDDVVDLFFLQIQGSGIVKLENGENIPVGYAEQNGQPYQSIGKVLIDRGELTADKASMQGIKEWGRRNPERLPELLNANPSYVFFRELPSNQAGPLGALGVPLTAERSIAIDPRGMPLGAPVWLADLVPAADGVVRFVQWAAISGLVVALLLYCISAFAVPLLCERRAGLVDAVVTSVRVVLGNFLPAISWAFLLSTVIIASVLVLPLLPLTLPWLAYASRALYREVLPPG